MPFIKLADGHRYHGCDKPKTRDDGTALVFGDQWQCDEPRTDGSGEPCGLTYQWSNDQREGNYWKAIKSGSTY